MGAEIVYRISNESFRLLLQGAQPQPSKPVRRVPSRALDLRNNACFLTTTLDIADNITPNIVYHSLAKSQYSD